MRCMRWLLLLPSAVLLLSCYSVRVGGDGGIEPVDALARARRTCVRDTECFPDERCRQFLVRDVERVCALPCEDGDELCADGSFCVFGWCFPGASGGDDPGGCLSVHDCAVGRACATLGPGTLGVCTERLCGDHAECPSGQACIGSTCSPVCHPWDGRACPPGTVCFAGQCRLPAQVIECEPEGFVDYGCEEGEVCWGRAPSWQCVAPDAVPPLTRCREDEAWLQTRRFSHEYSGCFARRAE